MVKRRGVSVILDEKFFTKFESARVKEQNKIREKVGGMFNLTQRNFSAILAEKDFKFAFPKNGPRRKRR